MTVSWGFEKYFAFIYIHWSCKSISKKFEPFSPDFIWGRKWNHNHNMKMSCHIQFLWVFFPFALIWFLSILTFEMENFVSPICMIIDSNSHDSYFLGRSKPGGNHPFWLSIQDQFIFDAKVAWCQQFPSVLWAEKKIEFGWSFITKSRKWSELDGRYFRGFIILNWSFIKEDSNSFDFLPLIDPIQITDIESKLFVFW